MSKIIKFDEAMLYGYNVSTFQKNPNNETSISFNLNNNTEGFSYGIVIGGRGVSPGAPTLTSYFYYLFFDERNNVFPRSILEDELQFSTTNNTITITRKDGKPMYGGIRFIFFG